MDDNKAIEVLKNNVPKTYRHRNSRLLLSLRTGTELGYFNVC